VEERKKLTGMISNVQFRSERRDVPQSVPPVAIAVHDTEYGNNPSSTSMNEERGTRNHSTSTSMKLPTTRKGLTETEVGVLKKQGFTEGLAKSMDECVDVFPLRYWIIVSDSKLTGTLGMIHTGYVGSHTQTVVVSSFDVI